MLLAVSATGVSPSDVLSTLSGYIGGNYASNMNRFSKLYRVMVQASPEFRLDTEALNNMFVRNSDGEMSPISQYLTLTRVYGSETLTRFNLFSAISVNGAPATGYSSGQAIQAVREVAEETLPAGYGFEFGGMSREESSTGNTTVLVFVICVVFIYLILCALYESLFIPLAVILSVPFGLTGSFLFAKMFGLENNIYLQTGLIMLIGLLAKTSYFVDRICFGTTSSRDEHYTSCGVCSRSAFATHFNDLIDDDLRYVAVNVCFGSRSKREYFYRCRDSRRYVDRYYSLVVYRTGFVYRVPISARENYASA